MRDPEWFLAGALAGALPTSTSASTSMNGYLAQAFPIEGATGAAPLISGTKYVIRVPLPGTVTFTTVDIVVSTVGATLTAGQNLIACYNSAGAQIGSTSADQSGVWSGTNGLKSATVGTPAAQTGYVYVEILSVGTTPPQFRSGAVALVLNANLAAATLRASTNGTGATAVDASITPSGLSTTAPLTIWVGLR